LSQTNGLKVANVPLVVDMPAPPQLLKVNPKRVFCLTVDEEQLKTFRTSRLRREMRTKSLRQQHTYADSCYIRRDLENATKLAHQRGFTEINVSGRAIEETACLIASKYRERFPESDVIAF
jgi:regulator of PEP synthase PpsR (kinase-PPPase family)